MLFNIINIRQENAQLSDKKFHKHQHQFFSLARVSLISIMFATR